MAKLNNDTKSDDEESYIDKEPPTSIDPYSVLNLSETATDTDIKKAYRRLALVHHPDKVDQSARSEAHHKFQEIVFAYSILSDPVKRKTYDATGSTQQAEAGDDHFGWKEYFADMYDKAITKDMIEEDKREYRESGQERKDILKFYTQSKGSLDYVFENVIHSTVLEDDDRFRAIIDEAIANEEVKKYKSYAKESKEDQKSRRTAAKKEEAEAEKLAKGIGLHQNATEADLGALIRKRQAARADNFFNNLEKKYGGRSRVGGKKGKKSASTLEPCETEFVATHKKIKK
ncbi:DnaJ domain-containing protein [Lipomyces japonicus]|uniref:DnaJ domain-containing protein n=1 Tax=Lipomyces japonicus TaxID=56871 RepID=UPI0034CD6B18